MLRKKYLFETYKNLADKIIKDNINYELNYNTYINKFILNR